jgi:23S rRNA (guanine745-N1)-methyltransferase
MKFLCPKCNLPLAQKEGGAVACAAGHSYDRSREGYYNLLLGSGAGVHGDNKEMVAARRAFLNTGAYFPLARRVAELCASHLPQGGTLLDVGCGEGYYTNIIESQISAGGSGQIYGFDISKDAVRLCARKNKNLSLAVASAYRMPFADSAFDVVTNLFSPLAREEILRVLRPRGKFIMAIPDREHLFGLKSAIYKTPYKNEVADTHLDGFELVEDEPLTYKFRLDSPEKIQSLFMMTPYAYRTRPSDRAKVEVLKALECTADFRIFVYKKS